MVSGNGPVKLCALRSLHKCALTVGLRRKQQRGERTHMLVILPMHHRSPSAAGTVPTSSGVLAETALLEFSGG